MSSLLPLIGATPTPIVEVVYLTVAGSGRFSGYKNYPASSVESTIVKLIDDKAEKSDIGDETDFVSLFTQTLT